MKALLRGQTEFVEVPDDQPVGPITLQVPTLTTSFARGSEAPADTHAASDHGMTRADSVSVPLMLATFDATSPAPAPLSFASAPFLTMAGPGTEVQLFAAARGDLAGMSATSTGDIGRVVEVLASLAPDAPGYADHGWFIVPSASNEYGPALALADDFTFDVAAGEFSADWFFWA